MVRVKIIKPHLYALAVLCLTLFVCTQLFGQVQFIENKGQWDKQVKFMSNAGDGSFFLTEKGYTISQYNPTDIENLKDNKHGVPVSTNNSGIIGRALDNKVRAHSYSVQFLNAQTPQILPDKAITTVNNYFIGNDKSKWASNCKIYQVVKYKNVYPGVDVRYYVDGSSNLKYDFIVHPGADINNIAMKYSGANNMKSFSVIQEVQPTTGDLQQLMAQMVHFMVVELYMELAFRLQQALPMKNLMVPLILRS